MRLGIKDHKVIRAFVERRAADGHKLSTDGQRLDGHWLGGARIADWSRDGIVFHHLGSRAAQSVQRQIRYHAAPSQLAEQGSRRRRSATRSRQIRHADGSVDRRYSIRRELAGHAKPQWVARFEGGFIGASATREGALQLAEAFKRVGPM